MLSRILLANFITKCMGINTKNENLSPSRNLRGSEHYEYELPPEIKPKQKQIPEN